MEDNPDMKDFRRWVVSNTDPYLGTVTLDATRVISLLDRIKNLEELREMDRIKLYGKS